MVTPAIGAYLNCAAAGMAMQSNIAAERSAFIFFIDVMCPCCNIWQR